MDYNQLYDTGLAYDHFLDKYANAEQRRRWDALFAQVQLTSPQRELLRSFRREMKVLILAGAWCGDCVNQCPIFAHFAAANDSIRMRYFDRDETPDLARELSICGAARVPSVLFLSEDGQPCGRYGDRTLSRYRQIASAEFGPACPTGLVAPEKEVLNQVIQEWLNEFERIQLLLRTSSRLRALHGD